MTAARGLHPSTRGRVPAFQVMEIISAANARAAAGLPTINLCAGEPRAGAPAAVRRRAAELLDGPSGYTEPLGTQALRGRVAAHYRRWYGLDVTAADVAVTTGSSGAFVLAFLAAFDVGDRVVVARPGYPAYRHTLTALGCDVVELATGPQTRYQPTPRALDALVASSGPVAGLVVASPANPTGTMLGPAELAALVAWCGANGVRLVSDEIYHGITYGAPGACAWTSGRDGVVVSSFSKYWGMTGWRLGWMLVPPDLRESVGALASNLALCPPSPAQHAALAAFDADAYAEADARVAGYRASRAVVLGALDRLGWRRTAPADGAFYVYAELDDEALAAGDSVAWCRAALDGAGVALTPGTDFDPVDGGRWVRLSFAVPPDVVADAVERLAAWRARESGAVRPA